MTILLAAMDNERVVIATDLQVSYAWHLHGKHEKQFKKRRMVMAGCGAVADIQQVQFDVNIPPMTEDHESELAYVHDIAMAIKNHMYTKYYTSGMLAAKKTNGMGASFIIVGLSQIYNIGADFSVITSDEVLADGSGIEVALGAYKALKENTDLPLSDVVKKAIEITGEIVTSCGNGVSLTELEFVQSEEEEQE